MLLVGSRGRKPNDNRWSNEYFGSWTISVDVVALIPSIFGILALSIHVLELSQELPCRLKFRNQYIQYCSWLPLLKYHPRPYEPIQS